MDIRERIEAFWSGERPDQIPYTIYWNEWRHTAKDPAWQQLFAKGLGVTYGAAAFSEKWNQVEWVRDAYEVDGRKLERTTMKTPVGDVYKVSEAGWTKKHWIETKEDYQVMKFIVEHIELHPQLNALVQKENEVGPYGVVHLSVGRTPLQVILVDYVGLENFSYHLFDYEAEMIELYDALLRNFAKKIEFTAESNGHYVSLLENFTAETMGAERFQKFHVPVYQKYFPMLQATGKIVGTHYDGRLKACSSHIAEAPIDLIESLTPPPEGDMTLSECRQAWPKKLFWSNINVSHYSLPPDELRDLVLDLVDKAAPDGRRLAFEVSEQYPENWKESMAVVLDALAETKV